MGFLAGSLILFLTGEPADDGSPENTWIKAAPPPLELSFPEPFTVGAEQTRTELEPFFWEHFCGLAADVTWSQMRHFDMEYGGDIRLDPPTLWNVLQEKKRPWKAVAIMFVGIQGLTQFTSALDAYLNEELAQPPSEDYRDRRNRNQELRTLGRSLARLYRQQGDADAVLELLDSSNLWTRAGVALEVADWPNERIQEKFAADHLTGKLRELPGHEALRRYQDALRRWREPLEPHERLELLFYATRRGRNILTSSPGGRWALGKIVELANAEAEFVESACVAKQLGRAVPTERQLCHWALVHLQVTSLDVHKTKR